VLYLKQQFDNASSVGALPVSKHNLVQGQGLRANAGVRVDSVVQQDHRQIVAERPRRRCCEQGRTDSCQGKWGD